MCGRYGVYHSGAEIAERFAALGKPDQLELRFNAAPTQELPVVIVQDGERRVERMRWGLVPAWAKDPAIGSKLINARAETLAEKPSFRRALERRRCLVPASGWYEWAASQGRQPYHIRRADGGVLALAGLWEEWRHGDRPLRTFTIVTTAAAPELEWLHHRMPAVLAPEAADSWLDPTADAEEARNLLHPFAADLEAYPVGRAVNRASVDARECIDPAPDPASDDFELVPPTG